MSVSNPNNNTVGMSDLYGSNESEDMTSFLQILLHNSSSSAAPTDVTAGSAAAGSFFSCNGAAPSVAESSSSINFSDTSCFFANDGLDLSNRVQNLGSAFEGSEGSENPAQRSSKRSRAAEVHNLTEKRRRSRINEKLKALQNLIPNSNKTDKASMLDEAIEYLKQLQLQVQMLTLRNGLSTHPPYSLGSLQSMLGSPAGLELDEANGALLAAHRGTDLLSTNQHVFMQSALETTNPSSSTQPMLPTSMTVGTTNSGLPPSFVPSTQNHYGLLNHLASSKDIRRDDTLSRLQLDISCSGNNSSPGVSS